MGDSDPPPAVGPHSFALFAHQHDSPANWLQSSIYAPGPECVTSAAAQNDHHSHPPSPNAHSAFLPGRGRMEVHGAMNKERHVCARRRVGEPAVSCPPRRTLLRYVEVRETTNKSSQVCARARVVSAQCLLYLADIFNIPLDERRERRIHDRMPQQALQPPFHLMFPKRRTIETDLHLKSARRSHDSDDRRCIGSVG